MSIFDLVLTGVSEIREKILNNNDKIKESANFSYLRLFLACFWPGITLVSVPKALNECI